MKEFINCVRVKIAVVVLKCEIWILEVYASVLRKALDFLRRKIDYRQ